MFHTKTLSRTLLSLMALGALLSLVVMDGGCRRRRAVRYNPNAGRAPAPTPAPRPAPEPGPEPAPEPGPAPAPTNQPGPGEVVVEVAGEGESKELALNDALRKAVEKGAGVEITSRTETMDYSVAFDKIISRSQGYVRHYDILHQKVTRWDARIKIRAIVSKNKIKDDWGQIQMILERIGRPTVMVFMHETVVGPRGKPYPAVTSFCATTIENLLLQKGFNLKSAKGMKEIEKRKREAALAAGDIAALKAIAQSYGADIMIEGKAAARWNGRQNTAAGPLDSYVANAHLRMRKADTGEIIVSESFDGQGNAQGMAAALTFAYRKLGARLAKKSLRALLHKWYFEFQHGAEVVLDLNIVSPEGDLQKEAARFAAKFISYLKSLRGVASIYEGQLTLTPEKAMQSLRVKAKLTAAQLSQSLGTLDLSGAGFDITVTGKTQHSVQVTLTVGAESSGGAAPPPPPPPGETPPGETPPGETPPGPGPAAGAGELWVQVTGMGENRDQAVNDALRKAVEKGAGVEITSRTETVDYAVAFDRIVSRSKGYVKTYKILNEQRAEFEHKVTIRALVSTKKIKDDWGQIQMLLERMGRPTVMVLVSEKVVGEGGKPEEAVTRFCETAIEELLLKKGFKLKSASGLKEIERRKRDAALATGDMAALKAIAMDYGANVMVVGKSVARWNGKRESYGTMIHSFVASASIEVRRADTADILVSFTFSDKDMAMGPAEAITKAFKKIGKALSKKMLKDLLRKWYFEFQHGRSIEVEVIATVPEGAKLRKAQKAVAMFVEMLKEIRGIDNIIERKMTTHEGKVTQKIEIKCKLLAADIKKKILFMETEGMGWEPAVTASDQNTLQVTLAFD